MFTRVLCDRPDLHQLRRQAKELLEAYRSGDATAVEEVSANYRDPDPPTFALHDAQLVIARSYGFDSWPKLKAYVDGVTIGHLIEAIAKGDVLTVASMLKARPELVHTDTAADDERRALHHAVLHRRPEMVRVLMEHGADPRRGVYPHRGATGALTLATERGYDEIVAIIRKAESHRAVTAEDDEFRQAIRSGDDQGAIGFLKAHPAYTFNSWTPLHIAASGSREQVVEWLLNNGADVNRHGPEGKTALDIAASRGSNDVIVGLLLDHGARMTLTNAVRLNRPDAIATLLASGADPDERRRVEGLEEQVFTWGEPLWHCAGLGRLQMAEMLLKHGADPNGRVYASGSPMFQAFAQGDEAMIALLQRYGGRTECATVGLFRRVDLARRIFSGELEVIVEDNPFAGATAAEQMLWGAACGGSPEIVGLAMEQVAWEKDDPRWYRVLEQPLRIWTYGASRPPREAYLECFRLVLERCDPNIRGRFGTTILHDVAGAREHVTAEERVAFATALLDRGARLDVRDDLLGRTPVEWARRQGRTELVKVFTDGGAARHPSAV